MNHISLNRPLLPPEQSKKCLSFSTLSIVMHKKLISC